MSMNHWRNVRIGCRFESSSAPFGGNTLRSWPTPRLRLLEETRTNHLGKLAFRWMYWNLLLPGRPIPLPAHMSMTGKHTPHPK